MHYADRRRGRLYRPPPSPAAFTPAERRLIRRLRTPVLVQRFLNRLPYNTETPPDPETLRSLREVLRHRTAPCPKKHVGGGASPPALPAQTASGRARAHSSVSRTLSSVPGEVRQKAAVLSRT